MPPIIGREVERLWQIERARRGNAVFNGPVLSAIEVSQGGIRVCLAEYRHLIAQRARPDLFEALNIRPVAVSGLLECIGGLVFGRRADAVTQHPGLWELVPSGGVEAHGESVGGTVDFRAHILKELEEEIGATRNDITAIKPFCIVEDSESHVIDIGVYLRSELTAEEIILRHWRSATREYDELQIVPRSEIANFVEKQQGQLVDVSIALIDTPFA
ncbi:MAG: hypothetical protein HQ495_15355 [Alphaproteobacteria bacterium]|nr:hypothetical protein [Alphaproteobacteria bacterium]